MHFVSIATSDFSEEILVKGQRVDTSLYVILVFIFKKNKQVTVTTAILADEFDVFFKVMIDHCSYSKLSKAGTQESGLTYS